MDAMAYRPKLRASMKPPSIKRSPFEIRKPSTEVNTTQRPKPKILWNCSDDQNSRLLTPGNQRWLSAVRARALASAPLETAKMVGDTSAQPIVTASPATCEVISSIVTRRRLSARLAVSVFVDSSPVISAENEITISA